MWRGRFRSAAVRASLLAAVEVSISDSTLVDGLAETLRLHGYAVTRIGAERLHVGLDASRRGAVEALGSAELELDLYLRAWEAKQAAHVRARRSG